jgi:hypothetical protein
MYILHNCPKRELKDKSPEEAFIWEKLDVFHLRVFGSLVNYGSFSHLEDMVVGFLEFKVEMRGVCKGCAFIKHAKASFLRSEHRSRGILDLINLDVY